MQRVAIVGRPNVGKSSLFNWLVGRRIAIVDPTAGVTRDRISARMPLGEREIELIDTGGMGIKDPDGLTAEIEGQISLAIEEAAVLVFVVDAQSPSTSLDQLVVDRIRSSGKPVILVVNKCDSASWKSQGAAEYSRTGYVPVAVSAINNLNKEGLLAAIAERLPAEEASAPTDVVMKIAVVGKRNAGKSTFINALAQSDRVIVSEVPGTTRDSVDVHFERNGQVFIAIDTAGVRRKQSLEGDIEFYSYARAQQTIRRADVVMLFLDPTLRIGAVDKKLAQYVIEHYKPCVFVVNKWDLMGRVATGSFNDYIDQSFPGLPYAPRVFVTARTGKNAQGAIDVCQSLFNQARQRVTTGELNRIVQAAIEEHPPPVRQNKRPRIYFATQVDVAPPTLTLVCNNPKLFEAPYLRYLLGYLRDRVPYSEVPIKFYLRRRDSHSGGKGTETPVDGEPSEELEADESDPGTAAPAAEENVATKNSRPDSSTTEG